MATICLMVLARIGRHYSLLLSTEGAAQEDTVLKKIVKKNWSSVFFVEKMKPKDIPKPCDLRWPQDCLNY